MTTVIKQLIRNVFTSWMGMVLTLVITFFFTPYLIGELGKSQYGIWSLVFSLVAYMRLADVGMNQAVARYFSKYYAVSDWKQLNEVVSSAARIYVIVSIVIVAASALLAFGVLRYFQIEAELLKIAQITLLVIGINQAVTYIMIPFAALLPFHRADILNYFDIGTLVVQTAIIVLLLEMGYGLVAMALLVLTLNIVSHLWRYTIRRRLFPEVKFSRTAISSEKTRELLHYGGTSLLIVAAWIVIFQTDNIVIGRFLSMEAVAVYAVPAMIITQLRNSIGAIATPIVPTISHIEAESDETEVMKIYFKSSRYLYYLSAYIGVGVIMFGGPFILLWVKEGFAQSIDILYILTIPAAIYLPQMIANSILFGVSRHKVLLYVLAAEGLSNIGLSLALVRSYGIVGVALGTAIPQAIIYLFIYPYLFHRVMSAKLSAFYFIAGRSILLGTLFTLPVAWIIVKMLEPDSWPRLIAGCGLVSVAMLVGFVTVILERDDRERILRSIKAKLWLSDRQDQSA